MANTWGADPQVAPTRVSCVGGALEGEEVVTRIKSLGGEDRHPTHEQVVYLLLGAADGSGRGDNLRSYPYPVQLPGRQVINGGLVEANQGTEGTADQV